MTGELEWWRPLVQWVRCLPHNAVAGALAIVQIAVGVVIAPYVIVTGRVPAWVAPFHHRVLRHRASTFAYLFVLRPRFESVPLPPLGPAPERVSRWSPIVRPFVVLPQVLLLVPVGVVLDLCYPVWMVGVAVNRGWPPALHRMLVTVEAWVVAILAYVFLATDERPTVAAWQTTEAAGAT